MNPILSWVLRLAAGFTMLALVIFGAWKGGHAAAYEIVLPAWLTGVAAGGIMLLAGLFAVLFYLMPAAASFIESPTYRNLAKDVLKDFGAFIFAGSLAVAFLSSLAFHWAWYWAMTTGGITFALVAVGIYVWGWAQVYAEVASATFVAGAYRAAGVPIES